MSQLDASMNSEDGDKATSLPSLGLSRKSSSHKSSSRVSSSKSTSAKLRAKAVAKRFRAEEQEKIIQKEAEVRAMTMKVEAEAAELEAIEYDRQMAEMDEILERGRNLTSQDRVRDYLSKSLPVSSDQDINYDPSRYSSERVSTAHANRHEHVSTARIGTATSVTFSVPNSGDNLLSFSTTRPTMRIGGTNVHSSLTEYQVSTSESDAIPRTDCQTRLFQVSPLLDRGVGLDLDPPLVKMPPSPRYNDLQNTTCRPPTISVATPATENPLRNHGGVISTPYPDFRHSVTSPVELLVSDCVATNTRIAEMLAKSQLPSLDCETFSDDPIDYVRWKRQILVQLQLPMSNTERVLRLVKHVKGESLELVKQYSDRFPNDPKKAYDRMWEALDHRYGRSSVIANAILMKMNNFPHISLDDTKSLRKFSDLCVSVSLQIESLPGLAVLNFPLYLKPVVSKLPEQYQRKWTDHAFKLINNSSEISGEKIEYPSFEQFSKFLENLSEKVCDPNLQIPKNKSIKMGGFKQKFDSDKKDDDSGEKSGTLRNCPIHPKLVQFRQHKLRRCRKFQEMTCEEQVSFLKGEIGKLYCRSCLDKGHSPSKCRSKVEVKCDKCDKKHFGFLHEACEILRRSDNATNSHVYSGILSCDYAISPVQQAFCNSDCGEIFPINVFHDTGSGSSMVLSELCEKFGFRKISETPEDMNIEVLGGSTFTTQAFKYLIPLLDSSGNVLTSVVAYGIEKIGSDLTSVDLTSAKSILGLSPDESSAIEYPTGPIHLLLGMNNSHAGPIEITRVGGIIYSESPLGKMIYGNHESFAHSGFRGYAVKIRPADLRMDLVPSLFATDVLGISCVPRCGSCACKKCPIDGSEFTLQERFEYNQIKDSFTLENGNITSDYPYVSDLSSLPDNYPLALKRLEQTERSLQRDPERAGKYQEQIDDMINRGVMRKLTEEEEAEWTGAVQYLPHHDVPKPGSLSTPIRLVLDSSAVYKGKSINQYWGRGPCLLNNPIGILLRFREHPTAFAGDISKMYWCVHTRPREWHLHRFLWRDMDTSRPPDKYVIVRNSFGSGPAGTVAIAALNFLADLKAEEFPKGAKAIREQAFVDDIIDSIPTVEEAKQVTSEIDQILSTGNFKIKSWKIVNVENSDSSTQTPTLTKSDSVLGIAWDSESDVFFFVPHLNFSKKKKKLRTGPDLLPGQVFDFEIVPSLTKRKIVSQVNSLYDPLGLLSPFLVELKFAVAKLWRMKDLTGWDDEIPKDHDEHWRKLFETFFGIRDLKFPRVLRPSNAVGAPILLAFSDSSMISYCAVLYVRWTLCTGEVFGRLLDAKTRIWPIEPEDYLSVARGELQGIFIAKRLVDTAVKESRFEFSEILYITDSEICMAQIRMSSHDFGTWTGSRVAEIRNGTNIDQFWFTNSENNQCADFCSRGTTDISALGQDSLWQRGPLWMYKPREDWPLTQNIQTNQPIPDLRIESLARRTLFTKLPPDPATTHEGLQRVALPLVQPIPCKIFKAIQTLGESPSSQDLESLIPSRLDFATFTPFQEDFIASKFDLERHDSWNLWLAITARVLYACSWKRGSAVSFLSRLAENYVVSAEDREVARKFWLRQAQRQMLPDIKAGKYNSLTPFEDPDGIYRINGRSKPTTTYQPILLPSNHPVSRLLVTSIHRRCHDGRGSTATRTRADYHILKVRKLSAEVRANCQTCVLKEKRLLQVPMAPLPVARLEPTYPFEHTSCDLFGPFEVKLEGRITRNRNFDPEKFKAYGLLFVCLSTRAIHTEAIRGQDTDAFLLGFRRFVSLRGQPKSMYSDNGGQLVAANNELQEIVSNWDLKKLKLYGAENGMTWTFTSPGSPWANGISESMVRSIKRSLQFSLPTKTLTILELSTIFSEVSELLNERPIGIGSRHFISDDFDARTKSYFCPNTLLLGRCSVKIPAGPFETVAVSHENRFLAIQTIVTNWWKHWYEEHLPSLVRQQKWFRSDRHVKIGDIVQVKDLNPIRGNWNIAEIVDIRPSADNIPRNVLVQYKNAHPGRKYKSVPFRTQWRDVKNLSMLLPVEKRSDPASLDPTVQPFIPSDSK